MSWAVQRIERIYSSRWFQPVFILALIALILLAYSNTFNASFQFDDQPTIMENESIRSLGNVPGLLRGQRGVTMASFAINYAIGGLDVTGYHIVNVSIHIVNAIAAYFLVLGIFRGIFSVEDEPRARKLAAFSALLFALHPVQTQAVTYIVQRMESLAALFYLLGLLVFRRSAMASTSVKRGLLYAATLAFYILGFYSKETAFTFPIAVFLYDLYFMSKGNIGKVFSRWPVYVALAALTVFFLIHNIVPLSGFGDLSKDSSIIAQQAAGPSMTMKNTVRDIHGGAIPASAGFSVQGISPREYLFTQFDVLVYYISLLFVPINQNLDYDFPLARSLFKAPQIHKGTALNIPLLPPAASLAILLFILAFGVYLFLRSKSAGEKKADGMAVSFFIFWFFLILAPTSSFIPIVDVIFEHRLYLATLGFSVIFVVAAERLLGAVSNRLIRRGG